MTLFTGFWEARGDGVEEVAVTIQYLPADELLRRLQARLESVPAGTHIRIDVIAWADQ